MLLEVFYIKIKIKGYLKNITENKEEKISAIAIKNKDTITYIDNNIKHKIIINDNKIILNRDCDEYSHKIEFKPNKTYQSEYYLKELHTSINILIKTLDMDIKNDKILITYQIVDSNITYKYLLEMSDK